MRAASSKRVSSWRSAASTVSTRNGIATNVWATTTPHVVNGRRKSNQRSRYWPNRPRRPNEKNRATPPTTGGSTIDSVHSARTTPRPGKPTRASSQASGTPNDERDRGRRQRAADRQPQRGADGVLGERRPRASSTAARHSSPTNGRAKKATPTSGDGEDRRRRAIAAGRGHRPEHLIGVLRCGRDPHDALRCARRSDGSSGAAEAVAGEDRLAFVAEHEVDERGGGLGVARTRPWRRSGTGR